MTYAHGRMDICMSASAWFCVYGCLCTDVWVYVHGAVYGYVDICAWCCLWVHVPKCMCVQLDDNL